MKWTLIKKIKMWGQIKQTEDLRGQKVLELVKCHHPLLTMIFLEQYQPIKGFQEALHLHMKMQ